MHDWVLTLRWIKTKIENNWCIKMLIPNSTQAVAAAVQRSPELVRALDDSAAAQAKKRHLYAEIAELNRKRANLLTTSDITPIDARLKTIGVELRNLEKTRLAATRNVEHHQPTYAGAVRVALAQHRRDAAARVVAAITTLQKATAELDEIAAAIKAAGGKVRRGPDASLSLGWAAEVITLRPTTTGRWRVLDVSS